MGAIAPGGVHARGVHAGGIGHGFWAGGSLDLFDNQPGYQTSFPKNVDFIKKSTFFVVFKRLLFRN
ncbi:MAG: hypothetical protein LBQ14_08610 [Treponema sp.]|jgi:hypothetical protein|nr:hypothetical protein [Treponema sp.]